MLNICLLINYYIKVHDGYCVLIKTRKNQTAPAEHEVIIPIMERLNGHKQLIQAVKNEDIHDLLQNYVLYQNLYDAAEYHVVERLSSFQENMFLPFDTVECVATNRNGFCGYEAIGKSLGLSTKIIFSKMVDLWGQNGRDDLRMLAEECKSLIDMDTVPFFILQQKFWLQSEHLGLIASFYDATILTFMVCKNYCGYVCVDATKFESSPNRHIICLLYHINHYELLNPVDVFSDSFDDALRVMYIKSGKTAAEISDSDRFDALDGKYQTYVNIINLTIICRFANKH